MLVSWFDLIPVNMLVSWCEEEVVDNMLVSWFYVILVNKFVSWFEEIQVSIPISWLDEEMLLVIMQVSSVHTG